MKNKFLLIITAATLLAFPNVNFAQAPTMGTANDFVLFTSVGAVSHTGISHLTGNVGTNSGLCSGFGNVDGVMHESDGVSGTCAADLILAYNQLNATVPTFFPAPLLGNGQILNAGVYSIPSPATLNLTLILDGQGNPNAVFIFQIQGSFSTNANSKVKLINGALACNVFWKVEGLIDMATGTTMRGTLVANNAAINMNTGDTLEGRALSTSGAITVAGSYATTPIGCGSPLLTGPMAADLLSTACYTLFSSIGPVTNVGITYVTGDVGSDNGLTTGYNPLFVTGMIHPIPDASTAACASDLITVYNYLNLLPYDIELLYPAQFGGNLVLTPHTYRMNAACTFTDTLYLNAEGNANAVFVFQINGALSTSTYSKVVLMNGAQSQNIFWNVNGAVSINDYSIFRGTIICNNGAINLMTGVDLDGRAMTTTGALNTSAITAVAPPGCGGILPPNITSEPGNQVVCEGNAASFTVVATGAGLTYQWRKGNVNLVNAGNISGVTTATLTINPASVSDAALNYNVIVSGTSAPNDTSMNVSLTVNTSAIITTNPSNQIACDNGAASFSVIATGTALTYQWRKGIVNLINAGNISGATSAVLIINPATILDAATDYNVVITGTCSPMASSLDASLVISAGTIITSAPSNQTDCVGGTINFTVTATGAGLNYQWRKGNVNLINAGNISGVTTPTLTINPTSISDAATNYNVIITGTCSPNDTTSDVSLTLNTAPVITTSPVDQTICDGSSVTFSVVATGTSLTYQWRKGIVNLVNAGNISGVNTSTLLINPASFTDVASDYNVVITGTCSPNSTSANGALAVNAIPSAMASSNSPVCTDSTINLLGQAFIGGTFDWTGPNSFTSSDPNPSILTATSAYAGTYILTVTNNGCVSAPVSVVVVVDVCLVPKPDIDFNIPDGFSPNGDMINDVFVIRGIEYYPNNKFEIYNRWGNKVFQASPYQNEWDGKCSMGLQVGGSDLPIGTYFYILDLGDGTPIYKGTIYLNK